MAKKIQKPVEGNAPEIGALAAALQQAGATPVVQATGEDAAAAAAAFEALQAPEATDVVEPPATPATSGNGRSPVEEARAVRQHRQRSAPAPAADLDACNPLVPLSQSAWWGAAAGNTSTARAMHELKRFQTEAVDGVDMLVVSANRIKVGDESRLAATQLGQLLSPVAAFKLPIELGDGVTLNAHTLVGAALIILRGPTQTAEAIKGLETMGVQDATAALAANMRNVKFREILMDLLYGRLVTCMARNLSLYRREAMEGEGDEQVRVELRHILLGQEPAAPVKDGLHLPSLIMQKGRTVPRFPARDYAADGSYTPATYANWWEVAVHQALFTLVINTKNLDRAQRQQHGTATQLLPNWESALRIQPMRVENHRQDRHAPRRERVALPNDVPPSTAA